MDMDFTGTWRTQGGALVRILERADQGHWWGIEADAPENTNLYRWDAEGHNLEDRELDLVDRVREGAGAR